MTRVTLCEAFFMTLRVDNRAMGYFLFAVSTCMGRFSVTCFIRLGT